MANPLRIGVSGHRFLANVDSLRASVDTALGRLAESFPGRTFTALSSLAEGADRLVASRILERAGAKLTAVLPLPKDSYVADFLTPESRAEFAALLARAAEVVELPPMRTRDRCYEAAGEYVLGHCDVLFALWDGRKAQGPGGTGAIVERARARALPLVWVHAGNRAPGGTEPTSLGEEQGALTFERIRGADAQG
jgi:hypothetical protein